MNDPMFRYITIFTIIAFGLLLFFVTCSQPHADQRQTENNTGPRPGDSLSINHDLLVNLSIKTTNTANLWQAPNKILTFVNGGCSMCGYYMSRWKDLIESYAQDWNIPVIMIATGNSRAKIEYMAYDQIEYTSPLFYDSTNHIMTNNQIIDHPEFNTFLLDTNNRVVIAGNPTEDEIALSLYRDFLE